jgi:hypothetical protein
MNYYKKYFKYKNKYLQLINQIGGNQLTIILKFKNSDEILYKTNMEISPKETINDIIDKLIKGNIKIDDKKLIKEFFTSLNYSIDKSAIKSGNASVELREFNIRCENSEITFYLNPIVIKIDSEYIELKKNIKKGNTFECIKFFDTFTKDELFDYIITSARYAYDDHYKTILYYIARYGNIDTLLYLVCKLEKPNMSKLLNIRCADGRIVLFGAVDAIVNKKEIYLLIKSLTHPSLYKTTFRNTDGTMKNLKDWAEMRNLHEGFSDAQFVYKDVSAIIS